MSENPLKKKYELLTEIGLDDPTPSQQAKLDILREQAREYKQKMIDEPKLTPKVTWRRTS